MQFNLIIFYLMKCIKLNCIKLSLVKFKLRFYVKLNMLIKNCYVNKNLIFQILLCSKGKKIKYTILILISLKFVMKISDEII